jgi:hypothetical protein
LNRRVPIERKEWIRMGDLHVRFEVAFGQGLWLRMKAMGKGLGGMILLERYDMVNQWSFADGYVVKEGDWVDGERLNLGS